MSYRPKEETTHYILRVAPLRGPPIGGQENDRVSYPCSNSYTLSRFAGLPLKGKRGTWREKQASHILHVPFLCFPLWCLTAPPFPRKRGHYKAPLCCERLLKGLLCGALLSHRSAGEGGGASHQRGESHRRGLITVMVFMLYDTESKSRNAPCVPFRGRGPRSGEGMYEGKNDYDTRCRRDRRKAAL